MRSLRNAPTGSHVLLQLPLPERRRREDNIQNAWEARTQVRVHQRTRTCVAQAIHVRRLHGTSLDGQAIQIGCSATGNTCACPPKHIHMCLKLHAAVRITIQVRSMREHSSSTDLSKNRTHLNSSSTISELIPDKTKTQCATGNPMCAGTERRLCFEEGLDWRTSFMSTSMKVFFTPTAQYVMPSSSSS